MTITPEEGEAPFIFVKSRRYRRPPPTASTCGVKSYSNSTGSLNAIPSSSSGSGFSYTTRTSRKPRRRGHARSTSHVLNGEDKAEEEEEKKIKRATQIIDCFATYLSSSLATVSRLKEGSKGKEKEAGGRKSYAQLLAQCLIRVWPLSCHVESKEQKVEEEVGKQSEEKAEGKEGKPVIPQKIVCLGLGSPTTSRSAQVQLALMVVIRSYLVLVSCRSSCSMTVEDVSDDIPSSGTPTETSREEESANSPSDSKQQKQDKNARMDCIAWDPIFTSVDVTLLNRYGIRVVPPSSTPASQPSTAHNSSKEESINQHYTSTTTPTLLYMPHCDRELYEQILSLNYPSLSPSPTNKCYHSPPLVLLSNILSHYTLFNHEETSTLYRLAKQMQVENLPNWDSGKQSALFPQKARQDAPEHKRDREAERNASEVIGDFVKWWDKNGLRDLGFHWL